MKYMDTIDRLVESSAKAKSGLEAKAFADAAATIAHVQANLGKEEIDKETA